MPQRRVSLIRRGYDDTDGFDTGISHALLQLVSEGALPETFRISEPGRVVAFGKQDLVASGFDRAASLVLGHGFAPVIRLPGGHAVVFHEQTISFSWTIPDADPIRGIRRRFSEAAEVIVAALDTVGIESSVGEIPGEYCRGEFSVNHAGSVKLAGIGQRLAKGAAHVGGVLVVGGADRIRNVLVPVYDALGIRWNPSTVGALDDLRSDIDVSVLADSLVDALGVSATIVESGIDPDALDRARTLAPTHTP